MCVAESTNRSGLRCIDTIFDLHLQASARCNHPDTDQLCKLLESPRRIYSLTHHGIHPQASFGDSPSDSSMDPINDLSVIIMLHLYPYTVRKMVRPLMPMYAYTMYVNAREGMRL